MSKFHSNNDIYFRLVPAFLHRQQLSDIGVCLVFVVSNALLMHKCPCPSMCVCREYTALGIHIAVCFV